MKTFLAIGLMCAACVASAKPELSNEGFGTLVGQWFATEQCAIQGRISAETAAYGKQILREAQARYEVDQERFDLVLDVTRKRSGKDRVKPELCNRIGMEIEDLRLQRTDAARKAKAEVDAREREAARARAQDEARAKARAEMDAREHAQAQLEYEKQRQRQAHAQEQQRREQQEREANAAYRRQEMEGMTQQLNQLGQQFRDFGNSVQPRTTNCTRTMMGANCVTY